MTKEAIDALNFGKKRKSALEDENVAGMTEEEGINKDRQPTQAEKKKMTSQDILRHQILLQNAKDQVSAFLSFKEAFCSGWST